MTQTILLRCVVDVAVALLLIMVFAGGMVHVSLKMAAAAVVILALNATVSFLIEIMVATGYFSGSAIKPLRIVDAVISTATAVIVVLLLPLGPASRCGIVAIGVLGGAAIVLAGLADKYLLGGRR